ncbi:MAG: ATP-binding protein [Oscillochloridaceae bacterium umkhey_bin13]
MAILTILVCGPPQVQYADQPVRIERRKAIALLAYLALAEAPVSRDELATLLWPELDQQQARAALRTTLPSLTAFGPPGWLQADRHTLAIQPERVQIDGRMFRHLVASARSHLHPEGPRCAICAAWLREAVALVRGEFLQGFGLSACPDFEAWQLTQREALRYELDWALSQFTRGWPNHTPQDLEAMLAYGRQWVGLDPFNEVAHRRLMQLYAETGRRSEALRQYQRCADLLWLELGAEPAAETQALYGQLLAAVTPPEPTPPPAPPPEHQPVIVPVAVPHLIGRTAELAWLRERLTAPRTRLVSLVGPGGIGKTSLANQVILELAGSWSDGSLMVALSSATSAHEAANLIAVALGLSAPVGNHPLDILAATLSRRQMLLGLDNLEQISDAAELVQALIHGAPQLRLLVTSRERLTVPGEQILPLQGLSHPNADDVQIDSYPAVQLLAQRAAQFQSDFMLTPANQAAIIQICRLTAGLPLALELAAAWMRLLDPMAIADALTQNVDFLVATGHTHSERHRSMRAVFDHSWQLLDPAEQRAFRRLGIFPGSFEAAQAQTIAELTLTDLLALNDKSLLAHERNGRYELHPLLRQYAAEQLATHPAEQAMLQRRHAQAVATMVARLTPALHNANQGAALATLSRDAASVRAAWLWAVTNADLPILDQLLDGLARFGELRNYRHETVAAMVDAETRLAQIVPQEQAVILLRARVLAWQGHFLQFLGRYAEAEQVFDQALARAQPLEATAIIAFCLKGHGINANACGEYVLALTFHERSLALYQQLGDADGIGDTLNRMGGAAYDQGNLPLARHYWEASHAAYAQCGNASGMARALNNLGEVCRIQGDYATSRQLSERSLVLQYELGPGWSVNPRNNLALLARYAGNLSEARRLHERSLAICETIGDLRGAANTNYFLGELALVIGDLAAAEAHLLTSLRSYRASGQRQGLSACLTLLAELALIRGEASEAQALAREALALAEVIAARLNAGRAMATLGFAQALGGETSAAAATLKAAEELLVALGAKPDAERLVARRREVLI